jgi:hypothetical protein
MLSNIKQTEESFAVSLCCATLSVAHVLADTSSVTLHRTGSATDDTARRPARPDAFWQDHRQTASLRFLTILLLLVVVQTSSSLDRPSDDPPLSLSTAILFQMPTPVFLTSSSTLWSHLIGGRHKPSGAI